MSNLFQSKALLAKLLAKENLYVEERRVNTASFNLHTRVLSIPILKNTLQSHQYDLFIGHEVGHALFTPPGDWSYAIKTKKIPKSVVNVVEDARIERKIKTRYPGLKNSFIRAYRDLHNLNFFETDGEDLNKYNFIDRANLYYKLGAAYGIEFKNQQEKDFITEIDSAETFEDVIVVSEKIAEYMREEVKSFELPKVIVTIIPSKGVQKEKQKQEDKIETLDDVDELLRELEELLDEKQDKSDEKGEEGSTATPSDEESDEEPQSTNSGGQAGDEPSDEEDEGEPQTVGDLEGEELEEKIRELIESHTDQALRVNEKNLYDTSTLTPTFVNVPKFDSKNVIVSFKQLISRSKQGLPPTSVTDMYKEYFEYSKSLSKVVSYLLKEFELRKNADQQKRTKISKTGEIDTKRLHAYRITDDIFKRLTTVSDGKSHGLVLFLDWSGSMGNSIKNTIRQLLSLVLFCKKANIPFEVYAFSDNYNLSVGNNVSQQLKDKDFNMESLYLLNILSSKMNASEFKHMAALLSSRFMIPYTKDFMKMNGTPLNEAIVAAMDIVPKFKEQSRVQIVNTVFLTDGESTNGNFVHTPGSYRGREDITGDYVITDPKTRYSQKVNIRTAVNHKIQAIRVTQALMELFKHRTGSKVIGFYLVRQRDFKDVLPYYSKYDEWYKGQIDFTENKCTFVKTTGYDEFYFIKDESQDLEEFSDVDVKNTSVRSVLAAFKKYSTNKIQSRTVLNRFIKVIS